MSSRSTRSTYNNGARQGRKASYKPSGLSKPGSTARMFGQLQQSMGRVAALQKQRNEQDKMSWRKKPARQGLDRNVSARAGLLKKQIMQAKDRVTAPEKRGIMSSVPVGGPAEKIAARTPRVKQRSRAFGRGNTRGGYIK